MKLRNHLTTSSILASALLITGCATIVDGGAAKISVKSEPSEARVTVTDKKGVTILTETTPTELRLDRGAGYFAKAYYTLNIEKPGYSPVRVEIKGTMNGWYIGNLVFGGLIGFLIVDPLTGAMYHLEPV